MNEGMDRENQPEEGEKEGKGGKRKKEEEEK